MKLWRLRLGKLANGENHDAEGQYVISYDPDYHLPDGSYDGGALELTDDPNLAGKFGSDEAMMIWQASPSCRCHKLRPDGERNRPLTAFHAEII